MARIRPEGDGSGYTEIEEGEDGTPTITVRWRKLLTGVGMGIVTSVFFGIAGWVQAVFDALTAFLELSASNAVTLIESVAGQSDVIEAAWAAAIQTVGDSGLAAFVVGVVVAASAWLVFAAGVSLLE